VSIHELVLKKAVKRKLKLQYRKAIDGLRTVAVLAVIFFHGGLLGITSGYEAVKPLWRIKTLLFHLSILPNRDPCM
jgi:peptidoglycan/LPS O-acetylase OafA/YrhL